MKLESLIAELDCADAGRSARAVGILMRRKDPSCVPLLLPLSVSPNFTAACSALAVLPVFGDNRMICHFLLERLRSRDAGVRERAAFALKDLPQRRAFPALMKSATRDRNASVRAWSLHALSKLMWNNSKRMAACRRIFLKATRSPSPQIRHAGFEGLFSLPGDRLKRVLERALRDRDLTISKASAPDWAERLAAKKPITSQKP
ncbi:MAG TPA: hypothetical protein DD417_02925 [Elusimicrobia bacterium]|nr:hypothetical protein [Elusimicrobiota bacterium]